MNDRIWQLTSLAIDLRGEKALSIDLPTSILLRVQEVIE
jgi:hypothetical protein